MVNIKQNELPPADGPCRAAGHRRRIAHRAPAASRVAYRQGDSVYRRRTRCAAGRRFGLFVLGERVAAGDWLLLVISRGHADARVSILRGFFSGDVRQACPGGGDVVMQHLMLLADRRPGRVDMLAANGKSRFGPIVPDPGIGCFSCFGVGVQLLSDTLLTFLLALSMAFAAAWRRRPSPWLALALGVTALAGPSSRSRLRRFAGLIVCGWMLFGRLRELSWRLRIGHC